MVKLTRIFKLTWLNRLSIPSGENIPSNPNDPNVTDLFEIKSSDGVLLVTADGNYLGTES